VRLYYFFTEKSRDTYYIPIMAPFTGKRRRGEDNKPKKSKKPIKNFKKQKWYHSSSESEDDDVARDVPVARKPAAAAAEFTPVNMEESEDEVVEAKPLKSALKSTPTQEITEADKVGDEAEEVEGLEVVGSDDEDEDEQDEFDLDAEIDESEAADEDASLSEASLDEDGEQAGKDRKQRKRNDPSAFANSMSKILSSKLSTLKRADPVLSRSVSAAIASRELTDSKLEAKARRKLHAEKQQALERGRVKDVLGLDTTDVSTAGIQEQEKRLKKTAQRGVVRLFNAVRAAQLQGQKAREDSRKEGVVGIAQREERVSEMSKKGFLDLIAQGGKKTPAMNV